MAEDYYQNYTQGDYVRVTDAYPGEEGWRDSDGVGVCLDSFGACPRVEFHTGSRKGTSADVAARYLTRITKAAFDSAVRVSRKREPEPEPKFHVGDRVRIKGDSQDWGHGLSEGDVATVLRLVEPGLYDETPGYRVRTDGDTDTWDVSAVDVSAVDVEEVPQEAPEGTPEALAALGLTPDQTRRLAAVAALREVFPGASVGDVLRAAAFVMEPLR